MKRMMVLMTMTVVGAGMVLAQPGPGPRDGRMGRMARPAMAGMAMGNPGALKEALGLSDAQVEQLRNVRRDAATALKPEMEKVREKQRALGEAMKADNPDPAVVGRLMVEMKQMRTAARPERAALKEKALAILTAEQKAKLAELEKALKMAPAARQAAGLGLIEPPEGMMEGPGAGRGAARARMARPGRMMR